MLPILQYSGTWREARCCVGYPAFSLTFCQLEGSALAAYPLKFSIVGRHANLSHDGSDTGMSAECHVPCVSFSECRSAACNTAVLCYIFEYAIDVFPLPRCTVLGDSRQPLESAEFRLRVSNSVDPATMYERTLKATKASVI